MGKSPEMFPGREKTGHLFMSSRGWTKSGAKASRTLKYILACEKPTDT